MFNCGEATVSIATPSTNTDIAVIAGPGAAPVTTAIGDADPAATIGAVVSHVKTASVVPGNIGKVNPPRSKLIIWFPEGFTEIVPKLLGGFIVVAGIDGSNNPPEFR